MLYSRQMLNPRSPLTTIRNQIKSTQQSLSRSVSRSPSHSPVSCTSKAPLKDYTQYIPVRSSSRLENKKPKSVTETHLELKSKRKSLNKETKNLEKRVQEIRKKIENEVKVTRIGLRKTPRSTCVIFCNKLHKALAPKVSNRLTFGFSSFKNIWKKEAAKKNSAEQLYKTHTVKRCFKILVQLVQPRILKTQTQNLIAKQHYKLQLMIKTLTAWQEFVNTEKLNIQDRSYIEEIDTLLQSFIQDSLNLSNIN